MTQDMPGNLNGLDLPTTIEDSMQPATATQFVCRRNGTRYETEDADALEKRNRILLERNLYSLKRYNEIPPEEEAGSKVPKGRSQIDLVGAVGTESLPLVEPAHDIWRQSAPNAIVRQPRPTSERTMTLKDHAIPLLTMPRTENCNE